MPRPLLHFVAAAGGDGTAPALAPTPAAVDAGFVSGHAPNPGPNAGDSPAAPAPTPGKWKNARAGDMLEVTLGELRPTQGALGYDQIYYKLGRYERQPDKKFDDFCADDGLGGIAPDGSPRNRRCATRRATPARRAPPHAIARCSTPS